MRTGDHVDVGNIAFFIESEIQLNEAVNNFNQACERRRFMVNVDKSKVMAFHTSKRMSYNVKWCRAGASKEI